MEDETSQENPQETVALTPVNGTSTFKWTVPKLMAVTLLCEGEKNEEIARKVNVSISTLYEWKRNPEFVRELNLARETIRERLLDKQVKYGEEALEKVYQLMQSGSNRQRVQLDAALALVKGGVPVQRETQREETGQKVKVVVVNNTLLANRRDELKNWEDEMGYRDVKPPKLIDYEMRTEVEE